MTDASVAGVGITPHRAIRLRAGVVQTEPNRAPDGLDRHVGRLVGGRTYIQAEIGPSDISLAGVHDATGEATEIEALRLIPPGDGDKTAEWRKTSSSGRLPMNASGGLGSRGHPIGTTGLGQIHELVLQPRCEAGPRQVDGAHHTIAKTVAG